MYSKLEKVVLATNKKYENNHKNPSKPCSYLKNPVFEMKKY